MNTYLFYWEDEGRDGENSFTVKARDYKHAYYVAFESYGPQVDSMYYVLLDT